MIQLKVGSIVKLRSGSPDMTITEIVDGQKAKVKWFDEDNNIHSEEFDLDTLNPTWNRMNRMHDSSNSKIIISGRLDDLEFLLEFVLEYYGNTKNLTLEEYDRGCRLGYRILKNGDICLGWGFDKMADTFTEFPRGTTLQLICETVRCQLSQIDIDNPYEDCDGSSSEDGVLITDVWHYKFDENNLTEKYGDISSYGDVILSKRPLYYAK